MISRRRHGFALPAVLTVTGVVTLIFLVAITALTSLTREARSTRERVRFLQSALTAEATLQYLAATEPFNGSSLNAGGPRILVYGDDTPLASSVTGEATPIRLDGHPYEMIAEGLTPHPVVASLRDQAGMINLSTLGEDGWVRLGDRLGLSSGFSRTLPALMTDYADVDDLESINGAERARYADGGPPNRPMIRAAEFRSLLGIRQNSNSAQWRAVAGDLVVDPQRVQINVNTASPLALQVLFGVSAQQAEAAVRARERAPFLSLNDFVAASGANVFDDGERIFTFPAPAFTYTIADTRSAWRYRARVVLTPTSFERPFWIDQTEMTEAAGTAKANSDADRFPYTAR